MASPNRRHSLSALPYRHHPIPNSATSHPDNPIPTDPTITHKISKLSPRIHPKYAFTDSTRSSAESLSGTTDEDSASDAPSTPMTEPQEVSADESFDKLPELPTSPSRERGRRASTTYASTTKEINKLLGNVGSGTKFLEKYCCGETCCKNFALPRKSTKPDFKPIVAPDNDAFRFLAPTLRSLTQDTPLTNIIDMPEIKLSFGPLRRESIAQKFPGERHEHDAKSVINRPPHYMKPHPPYDVFNAPVYGARELTKPGAEKRTFHFDIDVTNKRL